MLCTRAICSLDRQTGLTWTSMYEDIELSPKDLDPTALSGMRTSELPNYWSLCWLNFWIYIIMPFSAHISMNQQAAEFLDEIPWNIDVCVMVWAEQKSLILVIISRRLILMSIDIEHSGACKLEATMIFLTGMIIQSADLAVNSTSEHRGWFSRNLPGLRIFWSCEIFSSLSKLM